MNNNKQSSVEFLTMQLIKNGIITNDDLRQAKAMHKDESFKTFKAGQESMEEGGKGFDQWYQETFRSNNED